MNLDQAIKKIINDHGTDILKDRRLVSMLSDLHAFGQLPYAANMLRQIYANGYGTKIHQLYCSQDQTEVAAFLSELRNKLGFDVDMLGKVLYAFSLPVKRVGKQKIAKKSQGTTLHEQRNFNDLQVIEINGMKEYIDNYGGIYTYPDAECFVQLDNSNISSYSIRQGTKSISAYAFVLTDEDAWYERETMVNISSIKKIVIPDSVSEIDTVGNPFCKCKYLQEIQVYRNPHFKVINNMLIDVDNKTVLTYYGSDRSVYIPNWITTIGKEAFCGCDSLQNIVIGNSVTTIGERAFEDCPSLRKITIPNSVKTIGCYAFYLCTSLNNVFIPDSMTIIELGLFSHCEFLQEIFLPDTIISIGEDAFSECNSLREISIPYSVTSIGERAFLRFNSNSLHIDLPRHLNYSKDYLGLLGSMCYITTR